MSERQDAQVFWLINTDTLSILAVHILEIHPPDRLQITGTDIEANAGDINAVDCVRDVNLRDNRNCIFANFTDAKNYLQNMAAERAAMWVRKSKKILASMLPANNSIFLDKDMDADNFYHLASQYFDEDDRVAKRILSALKPYYASLWHDETM